MTTLRMMRALRERFSLRGGLDISGRVAIILFRLPRYSYWNKVVNRGCFCSLLLNRPRMVSSYSGCSGDPRTLEGPRGISTKIDTVP